MKYELPSPGAPPRLHGLGTSHAEQHTAYSSGIQHNHEAWTGVRWMLTGSAVRCVLLLTHSLHAQYSLFFTL